MMDSSVEDSDALEESPAKSKWLMNKQLGNQEKKQKAIQYREQLREEARQGKINAFKKQYAERVVGKKDRAPAQQNEELDKMIVDTEFEEDVVQHIEGALMNINRRVIPFPYQISGRIGLRFWGKIIIQEDQFIDEIFPPNEKSLFDENITKKLSQGTLQKKRKKRRQRIEEKWLEVCTWKRPQERYGVSDYCVFNRVEASDVT